MRQSFVASVVSFLWLAGTQVGADPTTSAALASTSELDLSARAVVDSDGSSVRIANISSSSNSTAGTYNVTIELDGPQSVSGISLQPSQGTTDGSGKLADVEVYLSDDGASWGVPVTSGTFLQSNTLKTKYFGTTTTSYVKMAMTGIQKRQSATLAAAKVSVLAGAPKLRFNITVDSYESRRTNNPGTNAVDFDTSTIWHTQWSDPAGAAPFPHWARVDLGNLTYVNSWTYTPRQDCCNGNGNIGQYELGVSTDDVTYTIVAFGTFRDDSDVKTVKFAETYGRYVKLTTYSEAGNRGPWTSVAELDIGLNNSFVPPSPQQAAVLGKWGPTISFPIVPVAAALLENGDLLTWSSWAPDTYSNAPRNGDTLTVTSTLLTDQGRVKEQTVANTHHDMFCPGLSLDAHGRVVVTGGNSGRENSIYDPSNDTWIVGAEMNLQRGYQAQATLSDGNIFIIGGSWTDGADARGGKNGELYDTQQNTMTLLSGCPVTPILTNDSAGMYRQDNHAWLFAWHNSSVFQAGPSVAMNWFGTKQNGSQTSAGLRTQSGDEMNGNAVMYDVGRILTAGGSPDYQDSPAVPDVHMIGLAEPNTGVSVLTIDPLNYARAFASGVALPDGTVLITGGQSYPAPFSDNTAILVPELWNSTTAMFTPMAPHTNPRTYHSWALLMPDASVIHGGGGLCGNCGTNHFDAEVYYPPYLFDANGNRATQPKIVSTSSTSPKVGDSLTVTTDGHIAAFSLVRMGSATHALNTDQRRIPAGFSSTNSSNEYTVTLPSEAGVLIPGYWMLFGLNAAGVPSNATVILVSM